MSPVYTARELAISCGDAFCGRRANTRFGAAFERLLPLGRLAKDTPPCFELRGARLAIVTRGAAALLPAVVVCASHESVIVDKPRMPDSSTSTQPFLIRAA